MWLCVAKLCVCKAASPWSQSSLPDSQCAVWLCLKKCSESKVLVVLLQLGAKDLTVIICIKVMALFRTWLICNRKALCALSKQSCFYITVKYSGPYFRNKFGIRKNLVRKHTTFLVLFQNYQNLQILCYGSNFTPNSSRPDPF